MTKSENSTTTESFTKTSITENLDYYKRLFMDSNKHEVFIW